MVPTNRQLSPDNSPVRKRPKTPSAILQPKFGEDEDDEDPITEAEEA